MDKKNFKVFDEVLDGVQMLAADLTYAYLNAASRHQLGLAPSVSIGTDFQAVCRERGWEVLLHLAETCLKTQTAGRKVLLVSLPDGSHHRLVFSLQPLPPGLMMTSITIEDNATSDGYVVGSVLKSTSLSMPSHELNTPLASIQLSLNVLEKYNTGEHQAEREQYHGHIRNEAQNLLSMLARIKQENLDYTTTKLLASDKKSTYQELENKITALKKAQIDATANRDNQYKKLFDSMTEMVQTLELIYDTQGRPVDFYIRDANLSFAKFVGKTKDQLINKKTSSIFGVIEKSWLTSFAGVDKTGVPTSFENYGAEFDKYYYVTAWKISRNRVGVSYTDITDQKRSDGHKYEAKLALDKIGKELIEAQKLAQVGSWLFNPSTLKNEWSDEMFNIWDFDSRNGAPEYDAIIERIHTDDFELYNSSVAKASSLGTPYDIEFRICIPSGEQKTLRAICQPVLGDFSKVISLTGTNQDITAQKLFEESLVKHERLKAIGEMSSSIAHDFNNSLQGMMGNLEIIKLQNDLSDNALERLNSIGSIITDVAGRVSKLQHFGDPGHDNNKAEFINLNTMIIESLEQSRPLWKDNMEKKGLKISTTTNFGDIPKISCNRGEIKSAIYNLIKNSIEAMPIGGDVIIKTGMKPKGVFATFTDTGTGMDEETKLKIFQPFFTTKGYNLGRGLGMSGVYSVIKRNKGDVAIISSELGKGTTIEIVFPIGQQDRSQGIGKNEPGRKDKNSFRVLWVDDNSTIRESASALVELMGHNCGNVNSGQRALEYLNKSTYDIVFTDIGMPNMNGWELADAIRNKFGSKIKIVVVTGWSIDEKTKNEHDIDFVLQKPFTVEELENIFLAV